MPRRFWIPTVAVALPVALLATRYALNATDTAPQLLFPLTMASQFALVAALLVVIVWFFLLGGFGRRTKLVVGLVALAGVALVLVAVRKVEFDGQMTPHPVFRWEPSAAERLAEFRASAPATGGSVDPTPRPGDSPAFRGPAGTGLTPDAAIPEAYRVKWRHPVGGGHGGIAVSGEAIITIEQRGDDEAVVCYDRATGSERWVSSYPAHFATTEPLGGGGPRTTPTIRDGAVYSVGALGNLVCLDAATGSVKWKANALADSNAPPPMWAVSGSPLVVGELVIVNPGVDVKENSKSAVAAYDRATGQRVWATGAHPAAYASPSLMTFAGVPQVVVFDADGLGGYDPKTGSELWRHPWKSDMGMNSAQPLAVGPDTLFVSSEKSNGGSLLRVTLTDGKWAVSEVWNTRGLSARYTSPVLVNGHIYGLTDGRMVCLDPATGKRLWAEGSYGNGQILTDGKRLVVSCESGDVAIIAANGNGHEELSRLELFDARTWNTPALAGTQLFVRNHREMACLGGNTESR